jgi:hypothetical protein
MAQLTAIDRHATEPTFTLEFRVTRVVITQVSIEFWAA